MDGRKKRKKGGIQIRSMNEEALTKGQLPNPAMEEFLKKRMLSIMLCTDWVCAGTFVDHDWVSESTNSQHVEEVLGHGTGLRDWDSVRGTKEHVVVFSTYEVERNTGETRFEKEKYDEVVNMARNFETIWRRAYTKIVTVGVCGKRFYTQHTENGEWTKR